MDGEGSAIFATVVGAGSPSLTAAALESIRPVSLPIAGFEHNDLQKKKTPCRTPSTPSTPSQFQGFNDCGVSTVNQRRGSVTGRVRHQEVVGSLRWSLS